MLCPQVSAHTPPHSTWRTHCCSCMGDSAVPSLTVLRRPRSCLLSVDAGWDNASFRGYADYMQTDGFRQGLQQLLELAGGPDSPVAIMCAEVVSFRCHRSLISDAASVRGWTVLHITSPGRDPTPHTRTKFAVVEGGKITYPAYEHTPKQKSSSKKSSSSSRAASASGGGVKKVSSSTTPSRRTSSEGGRITRSRAAKRVHSERPVR